MKFSIIYIHTNPTDYLKKKKKIKLHDVPSKKLLSPLKMFCTAKTVCINIIYINIFIILYVYEDEYVNIAFANHFGINLFCSIKITNVMLV